jgi:hypothetical protein
LNCLTQSTWLLFASTRSRLSWMKAKNLINWCRLSKLGYWSNSSSGLRSKSHPSSLSIFKITKRLLRSKLRLHGRSNKERWSRKKQERMGNLSMRTKVNQRSKLLKRSQMNVKLWLNNLIKNIFKVMHVKLN